MCVVCQTVYGVASGALAVATSSSGVPAQQTSPSQQNQAIQSRLVNLQSLPKATATIAAPKFEKPQWYQEQEKVLRAKAVEAPVRTQSTNQVVTYSISTRGATSSNLAEFSAQVNQTLSDSRGWAQLGVTFREVSSGGNFNLILSEAAQMPTFSSGCSVEWSCRVGSSVIINDARWAGATSAWNAAGGDMRNYRHMVVNHEVGHWLGHGHLNCSAPGALAPVMQQQSIDLQGCAFNPWPQHSELWSTTLGIQ